MSIIEALQRAQEKRKTAHMRRIKVDKMKELLEEERRNPGGSTPSRRAPAPPQPAQYNPPGMYQ